MLNRRNFLKLAGTIGAGMFLDIYSSDIVKAIEQVAQDRGCQARMDTGTERFRLHDLVTTGFSPGYL